MRKNERSELAGRIAEAAEAHGAAVKIGYDPTWREHRVEIIFPDVRGAITLDRNTGNPGSSLGDVLVSWHNAERDLNPHAFHSVNRCHFRKASDVAPADAIAALIGRRCGAIARGTAFR